MSMSAGVERAGWSLASRIVSLAMAGILLSSLIVFLVTFRGPPPMPAPTRISDLAASLTTGSPTPPESRRVSQSTALAMPTPRAGEQRVPSLESELARLAGLDTSRLRVWVARSGPNGPPDDRPQEIRGEFTVAANIGIEWHIIQSRPLPLIGPWQRTVLAAIAVSALILGILAWWIARAIARPLSSLATAAESISVGRPTDPIAVQGPPEVRAVASAMNEMQNRIARQVTVRTDMLAAIAHDLGTPLARLAFLIDRLPDADRKRAELEMAEMRAMIGSVIDFARHDGSRMQRVPVDLAKIVREAVGPTGVISGDQEQIISGDALSLRRMISNLVENARRYAGEPEICLTRAGQQIMLSIKDDGSGIPEHLLPGIQEPFARGEPSRNRDTGGTGLGLAIVRSIAEAHGGSLNLANRPTGGLIATIDLPLLQH